MISHFGLVSKGKKLVRPVVVSSPSEDTRAPSLFDTQLRHIFRESRRPFSEVLPARRAESQPAATVAPAPRERLAAPRHRPGQLRQRLQGSMATGPGHAGSDRQPVVQNLQSPRVAEVQQQREPVEPIQATLWDRQPPPQLNLHAQLPSAPQQLAIAHVQRKRDMASLGERLAILLPQSGSLPEGLTIGAPDVAVLPGSLRSVAQRRPQVDRISITAPETPEKVQKLSQKLTALLGPSNRDHPSAPSKRVAKPNPSSHELLLCL